MPNGGAVKLAIDTDKVGYVRLPTGGVLETVDGAIDAVYNGSEGRITYYVPKDSAVAEFDNANITGITGNISTDFAGQCKFSSQVYLTGITVTETTYLTCIADASLTNLVAPKAVEVYASGCALTAKSIGDFLIAASVNNPTESGIADFSGGTSANKGDIKAYMEIALDTTITSLGDWIAANLATWTITYND